MVNIVQDQIRVLSLLFSFFRRLPSRTLGRRRPTFRTSQVLACWLGLLAVPILAESRQVPSNPRVEDLRLVIPDGGRLDWSVQGDRIAYDKRDEGGFYDIHIATPDGADETCLSCSLREFRKAHVYNPSWHPSGEFLVVQVQPVAKKLKLGATEMTSPDRGLFSEIWTLSRDGRTYSKVSPANTNLSVLDPYFSFEGDLLVWSERIRARRGRWGEWVIRVARFDQRVGIPRIRKVKTYRPGETHLFLEAHGFSPDQKQILASGNLEKDHGESGMDLYLLDLESGTTTRVTQTFGEWDGKAQFSPDGKHILWTTNRNLSRRIPPTAPGAMPSARPQPRDLWMMKSDGSDEERLTFFNHPTSPNSKTGAVVSDFAWSPEGDKIALHVVTDFVGQREAIYILELRPPPAPSKIQPPS